MQGQHDVTITKVSIAGGTGVAGSVAKAVAENYDLPTTATLIGWLTVLLLCLQIYFLIYDRVQKRKKGL